MVEQQALLAMRAILNQVAREAAEKGYGLVSTLAAAAAEAAGEELAAAHRHTPKSDESRPVTPAHGEIADGVDDLAYALMPNLNQDR